MRARDDRVFLDDIVEAAANLARFVDGRTFEDFRNDLLFRSAVLYQVIVIGEAANRISRNFRSLHPEIPWRELADLRHTAIHDYFGTDWLFVWKAATDRIPKLISRIELLRH
ncbi:MAG: HepT-like ribonuclease domain-containing protein [Terriglobales bacterium]